MTVMKRVKRAKPDAELVKLADSLLGPVDIQANQIHAATNAMNEEKRLASLS